tara:strand:- start:274 stop:468 length:195 start_codon:yes stop_codon:yes gene_type:complete
MIPDTQPQSEKEKGPEFLRKWLAEKPGRIDRHIAALHDERWLKSGDEAEGKVGQTIRDRSEYYS